MIMENIYRDMNSDQMQILDEILGNNVRSSIYLQHAGTPNYKRYWMAIFSEYLRKYDKKILLTANRYYYKQADLDYYYPTNAESHIIGSPFSSTPATSELEINFVDTSTGAKIYEYSTELCKAQPTEYIDRPSLATSLTEDRKHKVKIINKDNIVWILSNRITQQFIEKCIALLPFLFNIKELQEDEKVINVCKCVAKDEPIKEYFQDIFDSLEEIREKQKIDLIKKALNARLTQQVNQVEREIHRVKDNIDSEETRLSNYYDTLEELQLKHLGLQTKKGYDEEQVNEILTFVEKNRYIQNMTTKKYYSGYSGEQVDMLFLDIIAPISIYEPEPLDRFINARIDDYGRTSIKGKILKAFKRIFVDQELQMICETFVRVDIANADITASSSTLNLNNYNYKRLCQPHLARYNCWGDNGTPIKQMLKDGDICNALNSIVIAVQNINFTDSTVLNSFLDTLAGSDHMLNIKSCLSKADGQLWSIRDIIDQLDREETNQEENVATPELVDTIPEADNIE